MDKSTLRRIKSLQALANQQLPAVITVTLATGEMVTTDSVGMLGICRKGGLCSIKDIQTDNPGYVELCGAMLAVYGGSTNEEH